MLREVKIFAGMCVLSLISSYVVCMCAFFCSMMSHCYLLCVFCSLLCFNYSFY
jgi:hypothetical protein